MEEVSWFSTNKVCLTSREQSSTRLKSPQRALAWALCQCGRDSDRDGEGKELTKHRVAACSKILGQRVSWPQPLQKTGQNTANL